MLLLCCCYVAAMLLLLHDDDDDGGGGGGGDDDIKMIPTRTRKEEEEEDKRPHPTLMSTMVWTLIMIGGLYWLGGRRPCCFCLASFPLSQWCMSLLMSSWSLLELSA